MHLKSFKINQEKFPTKDDYPFNLPLFQQSADLELTTPITIFTGENGSGKSTLLKALCRSCNIYIWEGIQRTPFRFNPYQNRLSEALELEWSDAAVQGRFFSPEIFRNYSQLVDEWAVGSPGVLKHYGGASLVTQSHGQSCMAYFKSIYKVVGLYFLDEPEAALSPRTQLELRKVLVEMAGQGHAQFIIATHSPLIMSCSRSQLYDFDGSSIEPIDFQETQHYRVYRDFFDSLR